MCRFVFRNREPLIIAGTEYQQEQDIAKLLGAPPGYVGHGQPGALTRYLQEKPYGLILLDEYEKGTEPLRLFFMNVLEEGYATTPDGIRLNFGNTIIIATSNAGAKIADERPDAENIPLNVRKEIYDEAINQTYNQALLGRFDGCAIFERLTDEDRLRIAQLYVDLFIKQARHTHGLPGFSATATTNFYVQLLTHCPKNLGARKIKSLVNVIMETVLDIYFDDKTTHSISLDWGGDFPTANDRKVDVYLG